ncbi:MAG TPA: FAD-dependent oxidoreductase [Nocardioidaceae bacterium]|nr:FAD-dependent oxidoreductase [Nocardioidaceae bacterium]
MRILVVGAGVIGLTCAVRLAEAGHRVDVVARELPLETTSVVAAALWYPYRAQPRERVAAWARATYAELAAIAQEDPVSGVRMLSGTEVLAERSPDPWWRSAVPELTRVAAPPAGYRDAWRLVAPVLEMPVYLAWLQERLVAAGGTVTRMALAALPDHAQVVVNATGLAGGPLTRDPEVEPVRGQVVYVEQFGLDEWWLDAAGPTYVVPRKEVVVVGGTDEVGNWDTAPDPGQAEEIVARAARLVPAVADAKVLRHRVGLRPARTSVRVAEEQRGTQRLLHCYGHGGAGVTLSWGCADEILKMC